MCYFVFLCIVLPLPPGTYPLAVNNNKFKMGFDSDDQVASLSCRKSEITYIYMKCLLQYSSQHVYI